MGKKQLLPNSSIAGQFREMAKKEYNREGTLEIDDGAAVSFANDGGAYVAAWVWVYGDVCHFCGRVFRNDGAGSGKCEDCANR